MSYGRSPAATVSQTLVSFLWPPALMVSSDGHGDGQSTCGHGQWRFIDDDERVSTKN